MDDLVTRWVAAFEEQFIPTLADHALVEIRCDHETGRDMPVCNCALVDLGWHPNVQAAKEAWAKHVWGELGRTINVEGPKPKSGWEALSDENKAVWTAMVAEMRDPATKPCGCGYPKRECLRVVLRNGPPYPPRPCEPEPSR